MPFDRTRIYLSQPDISDLEVKAVTVALQLGGSHHLVQMLTPSRSRYPPLLKYHPLLPFPQERLHCT